MLGGALFLKECRQIMKSLVYYLFLVIFVLFITSQMGETNIVNLPQPGQESYGTKESHDEQAVMAQMLAELASEIQRESFATYPTGFYKEVILTEAELEQLKQIVETCSGLTWEQVTAAKEEHYSSFDTSDIYASVAADQTYSLPAAETLTFAEFEAQMKKACEIIGAGSSYEEAQMKGGVSVPMTYEDALAEYEALCSQDKITGAYMRLFCDYSGIILSLLPIFLGVTRALRDKRSKAEQVIFSRSVSSTQIVLSRYVSNACMIFLPILLVAFVMQTAYTYQAKTLGVSADYLAFLKYSVIWLLPLILVVLAVSFFLTELLGGIASIILQVFWAMGSVMSATTLVGSFGWNLVPRWNDFGMTIKFMEQKDQLLYNRLGYTILALAVLFLTILVYDWKRRGGETIYGAISKAVHSFY